MTFRLTDLERAFELADSGECAGVSDVKARLKAERRSSTCLVGPSLCRQLRERCQAAQPKLAA